MRHKKIYYALLIFILALLVVAGFVATQPVNSLTMDVNPSIEIVTNRLDRVVEINPLNDDAKELLKDFDPKDKNLERTVNDLVDLMILTGHIRGGEDNFVMITVADDSVDSKLVDKVNRAIDAMLQNKQIEATILNQTIAKSDRGEKQTGVQLAARRLQEINGSLTAEQVGLMAVRELIHYSKENNIPTENLFKVAAGNIDKAVEGKTIISREEAERIALERVDSEIIKVELDDIHDDDDPEYEIEILSDGVKYEIEINAYTGEIKEFEIDDDDEYEIEIKANGKEYEIEIDAYTGKVLDFEVED